MGRLQDWLDATRFELSMLGGMPFALGAVFAWDSILRAFVSLVAGAVLYSASVLANNLADRQNDTWNPRKAHTAMVSGRLRPASALVGLAVGSGLFFMLIALETTGATIYLVAVPLAALELSGNVYQKRSRFVPPEIWDFLFGVTLGVPIIMFSVGTHQGIAGWQWCLACLITIDMAAMNVMVGNTKDLPWDLSVGDRTTSIDLGVRPSDEANGGLRLTWRYTAYTVAMLVGRCVVLGVTLGFSGVRALPMAVVLVASFLGVVLWLRVARTRRLEKGAPLAFAFVPFDLATVLAAAAIAHPTSATVIVIVIVIVISVIIGLGVVHATSPAAVQRRLQADR